MIRNAMWAFLLASSLLAWSCKSAATQDGDVAAGSGAGSAGSAPADAKPEPTTPEAVATRDAIRAGMDWLARHQSKDGSWGARDFVSGCKGAMCSGMGHETNDTGLTGLALLALHSDSQTYHKQIEKGLRWLIAQQQPGGNLGKVYGEFFYLHGAGTLALAAYAKDARFEFVKGPLEKAVGYLLDSQSKDASGLYRGWRYLPGSGESDTSVTSWAVMALYAARDAGVAVAPKHFQGAYSWVAEATAADFRVGYLSKEDAGAQVKVPGMNENYKNHEAMTAVGVYIRALLGSKKDGAAQRGAAIVVADLPKWDPAKLGNDYYYWHRGTLALREIGGPNWTRWQTALLETLPSHQSQDGCARGSWDADDRWGMAGGRVYATAMNLLSLELAKP